MGRARSFPSPAPEISGICQIAYAYAWVHADNEREATARGAEQRDYGCLVCGDAVEMAHLSVPLDHLLHLEALAPKHHLRRK
jgi:hypothetical protein